MNHSNTKVGDKVIVLGGGNTAKGISRSLLEFEMSINEHGLTSYN